MSDDRPPPRPETGGSPPPPPPPDDYWVNVPPAGREPPPPPTGGPPSHAGPPASPEGPAPPDGPPSQPPPPSGPPRQPPSGPHGAADAVGLRPRDVGGILDAAIRLYRGHWKPLMGIVSVLLVPATLIVTAITVTGSVWATVLATAVDYLVVTPLLAAAVVKASADVYLGDPVTVGDTYRFVWTKIGRLVGLVLLVLLLIAAPVAAIVGLAVVGSEVIAIVAAIAFVVLAVVVGIRWYFAATTIVLEDRGVTGSLARSWRLTGGHFWKTLGTLLVAAILALIVSSIISAPFTIPFFLEVLSGGDGTGLVGLFVQTIGTTIAAILTQPFTSLVGVLLYFDLRIRDEGFDLEVLARELRGA